MSCNDHIGYIEEMVHTTRYPINGIVLTSSLPKHCVLIPRHHHPLHLAITSAAYTAQTISSRTMEE